MIPDLRIFRHRLSLSVRALTTYLQCPRKYAFRFRERVTPEFEPAFEVFTHTLFSVLRSSQTGRPTEEDHTSEDLEAAFNQAWNDACTRPLRFPPSMNANFWKRLGELFLQTYDVRHGFFTLERVSEPFLIPLEDPRDRRDLDVDLVGTFDLICEGNILVVWRFGPHPLVDDELRFDVELSAYAFAFERESGALPRLRVIHVYTDGMGGVEQRETTRSRHDSSFFLAMGKEVVLGIEMGIFPPRPSAACAKCEFQARCQSWGAGSPSHQTVSVGPSQPSMRVGVPMP